MKNLEFMRREAHRGLDCTSEEPPNIKELSREIKKTQAKLDKLFNPFWGSLFRCGAKNSYFTLQVRRFADLYTSHFGNLANYPLFYLFASDHEQLPHEEKITLK